MKSLQKSELWFFEFINANSCSIFHYWIQHHLLRILNSSLFSVLNSYHEFIWVDVNSKSVHMNSNT